MKLLKLKLQNFKGIKELEIDTKGKDVEIFGSNATGKTTIVDAVTWLLFDKDSKDKSKFDIKTIENGAVKNGIDHSVEGLFSIDAEKEINLKKTYKEIWKNPRGASKKIFSGHTTDYFVDEVPVSKKEFIEKTSATFDEATFKLLTNPLYFSEILPWKKRREILTEICGDVSDDEIIDSDDRLKNIKSFLNDKAIEDYKKIIHSKRKKINEEADSIPTRIDEVTQGMPDVSKIDLKEEQQIIKTINDKIIENNNKISRIKSGGEVAEKRKEISEITTKILDIENGHNKKANDEVYKARQIVYELDCKKIELQKELSIVDSDIEVMTTASKKLQGDVEQLRNEFFIENKKEFIEPNNPEKCFACGAAIDESIRTETSIKALSEFNLNKSQTLEDINSSGKKFKLRIEELKTKIADKNIIRHEKANKLQKVINDLQENSGKDLELKNVVITEKTYLNLKSQIEKITQEIEKLNAGSDQEIKEIRGIINNLELDLKAHQEKINDVDKSKKSIHRIDVLKKEENDLAKVLEQLDSELFTLELFEKKKSEVVESKVNSYFELANFKLFDVQVNGGIQPCCETLFDGVPYNTGLNNAARINVGLDIINTLTTHYRITAPIFVDNAEAVVKLIDSDSQIIKLIVSKDDNELRVEV